jgi:hypothetical protein
MTNLTASGACLDVMVGITEQRAEVLRRLGAELPKRFRLNALIDPGATVSHVDGTCLNQLGLLPVGKAQLSSLSSPGKSVVSDLYEISMDLLLPAPRFTFSIPRILVFEIYAQHAGVGALIGQDILRNFVFTYDGKAGTFSLVP